MKRILFSHSYFLRFDPKQWRIMQPYPPLGTLYAAAMMRDAGYTVDLFDPMFASSTDELLPVLKRFQPDALVIYDDGFNYLTKMCLTNMREAAFRMIRMATAEGIPVFISSSDASDQYASYLQEGATAVIRGEGEITLCETLGAWFGATGTGLDPIGGIAWSGPSGVTVNPPRDVLKKLDEIPFPYWDLADIAEYKRRWMSAHGMFSMNMSTTRGCPYKCNWCAKPIYGNRYNSRTPANVVDELSMIREKYQPDHIWFCDDIFGLKPGWVSEFARLLIEQGLRIPFKIQSRVDLLLQDSTVADLASAGCETVWVGAESGSQHILDAMDKGTRVEQIHAATHLLRKHNIKPAFFLQFGYPGETMDDIVKTISLVEELLPEDIGISVSYPLPGTLFYDRVKEQLQAKANWTDSDDLSLMFLNFYPAEFYRHLHRYVHKRYRIRQGLKQLHAHRSMPGGFSWRRLATIPYHLPGALYHGYRIRSIAGHTTTPPGKDNLPPSREGTKAFNEAASHYDETFTHTTTGKLQRSSVYRYLSERIDPNRFPSLLEINGGTGEDALWFSSRGFDVLYTDGSERMVEAAKEKFRANAPPNMPRSMVMPFERLSELPAARYDLVFSNFGGLNCISPGMLHNVLSQVYDRLRSGGKFIAVVMGRRCLTEDLYFLLKNDRKNRMRRRSPEAVEARIGNSMTPVWYYTPEETIQLAAPLLTCSGMKPIGVFIPPSYLNRIFSRVPLLPVVASGLERVVAGFKSAAHFSDHYLIEFTRP